jgi:two-component system, NarL family, sensor histidine kinase UhpB
MNRTFFISLISVTLLFPSAVYSQNKMDSLMQVLKGAKEDSSMANTLNLLSRQYSLSGDYDQSAKYSNEAMHLSEKLNFEKGKAMALINMGVVEFYQGNYPEAHKLYSDALAISQKIKDRKLIAKCNNNIGLVFTYQRNYSEALKKHEIALNIYRETNDSDGIGSSYNNLGIIYEEQGNYMEAIKSYSGLLKIAEAKGDKKSVADALFNIGNVYSLQETFADAIKNHFQALKVYQEIGHKQNIALCYIGLANSYQVLDSLILAKDYSQKAFEILEAIGNKVTAAEAKALNAHVNSRLGNYSEALDTFNETLKLFNEIEDTLDISATYRGIGDLYFMQGKYDEALKNFQTGLEMAKAIDYKSNIVFLYGAIAEVYEQKKDFKNAYLNHKLYFILNDSLLNETKISQTAEMKAQYETEKKDIDIALLNKDKELQGVEIKKQKLLKYSFVGGFGLVIALMLIGYRTYRTRQVLHLQEIRNKIAGDLHDDIGSTLNSISIYSEVARKKDEQQDEALEMIGDAARKIIDAMSDIVWTINPDNDSFAKIIFRMKSLAYNLFRAKKIEFTFQADETLNDRKLSIEDRRNFYLIFKEAVNNLVKYSNATRAEITLADEKEQIRLRIQDNGTGFDAAQDVEGNGLKNMKRRANEMKAEFKIVSGRESGTLIDLILKA